MTERTPFPGTGYALLRVHTIEQSYTVGDPKDHPDSEDRDLQVAWDWRIQEDGCDLQVLLGIEVQGNKKAPETIRVAAVGTFRPTEDDQRTVELDVFVRITAVSLLFPYVREWISSLSSRGPYGTYYLQPVYVMSLAGGLDFDASTGAQQLRENEELASRFAATSKEETHKES